MSDFLNKYFAAYNEVLNGFVKQPQNQKGLEDAVAMLKPLKNTKSVVYLVGNGGSAAITEHVAIDLTKCNRIRAVAFSGTPTLTCLANDYGYERLFEKSIEFNANEGDVLIAISSGGKSKNILNAVAAARKAKMKVITLSGFSPDNPLRASGDINLWVDSKSYGFLEIIHGLLLHYVNDAIVGKIEYFCND